MTKNEFLSVIKLINDCDEYLSGEVCSRWITQIADDAAKRAVIERKESLFERLRMAGLNIEEEV